MTVELDTRRAGRTTPPTTTPTTTTKETDVVKNSVPIGQSGEVGGSTDSYSNSNTTKATQETNKRTENELYKSIEALCNKYGLDINQAKKMGLFQILLGKNIEELLDINTVPQNVLNEAVKKLENAINAIYEDIANIKNGEKKLTFDLIISYTKLLNEEVPAGWDSVDSFRKAQRKNNESLSDRLERYYNVDINKLKPEQLANYLEKYFTKYFKDLQAEGKSEEEIKLLQLTDFTKLLFNSRQEEYTMFVEALNYLHKDNLPDGVKEIIEGCQTQAKKTEIADMFTNEKKQRLITTPDLAGNVANADIAQEIAQITTKYKSEKAINQELNDIEKSAKEFYTPETIEKLKNITDEQIAQIREKINNNEEITAEELDILNIYTKDQYFKGNFRGNVIGITNNENVEETTIYQLLSNTDAIIEEINTLLGGNFKNEVYNNLLSQNNENSRAYILENFLNNEYEEALYCNGGSSTILINNPTNIGYTIPEIPDQNLNNNNLVEDFYNKSKEEDSDNNESILTKNPIKLQPKNATIDEYISEYGLIKGFTKYIKDNGSLASVLNGTKNSVVEKFAIKRYERKNSSQQLGILEKLCSRALSLVLKHSKDNTIARAGNMIFANSYSTELVRDAAEKLKEEKPEQFA